MFENFMDTLRARRNARRTYNEIYGQLSAMSDRELADINLHRAQIRDIAAEAARRT